MPTSPNNDRYEMPFDRGDYGWDDELCNIMDQLSAEVPTKGPLADRPAADETLAPHYYYATDQDPILFCVNVNETWEEVELGGGSGGSGGSFSGSHADLTDVRNDQHHEWPISANSLTFDPATQNELENHTSDMSNPHDVTASEVSALADSAGTVTPTNLSFDPATQTELDGHTTNLSNPHDVTASQAGALADATGVVETTHLATGSVTPTEVDGSGGASGEVLQTDGTEGGVSWASVSSSSGTDWSSAEDMETTSGNTWWTLTTAGTSTQGATTGSGGLSVLDGVNGGAILVVREGVPGDVISRGNLQVDGSLTVGSNSDEVLTTADEGDGNGLDADTIDGREIYVQETEPSDWSDGDIWLSPQN